MKKIANLVLALFLTATVSALGADAKTNWTKYCTQCHGPDGTANTPMGKKLQARNLTDPKVQTEFTDAQATKSIKQGVKQDGKVTMKAFGDKLTDDEVKDLVAYVRSLKK